MKLPEGLEEVRGPGAWGFAAPEAHAWISTALEEGSRLRDVAARHPDVLELWGRGPVHAVPASTGRWVVRPYRRGGAVARPLLGDRHARVGLPRPVVEARASDEARRRGIPTPRVLGGAVYFAGTFYRADLVTEYVAGSLDLASALFQAPEDARPARSLALSKAGALVGSMAGASLEHPDLNARNILLVGSGPDLVAMLLDLDRCALRARGRRVSPLAMMRRLERSLDRIAGANGEAIRAEDRAGLRRAVEAAS